jgi:hypothetical protein
MESTDSKESIRLRLSILSFLSPLLLALPALADVTLKVTPSRSKIYLGETFNLNIEVNGADRTAEPPDLAALPPAETQLLGSHSNSRSSITIINGRMTRESFEGRVFAYQIKPSAKGTFKAGPVRVTVAGKTYTHPGVAVDVAGVEKQDTVVARVTASSTSVLVEEPFTITLSVAVAELPEPYAQSNEPIHPSQPPHLAADFLEIRQPDPGLKGPDLNQVLNGLIDPSGRQPAFAINNYQSRDMGFGGLFDDDPFRPRPIRFRLSQSRITLDGKKYREYTLALNYTPKKEGEFTFGPVSFKGSVIADVTSDRQAVTQDVYAIGPAVTVRVVPPPDEGRPEWFVGSVGQELNATASFDATTCKVGDPLTLSLDVTGRISISNLRTPLLNLQPELAKDFRIYDNNVTADTLPDGKRFTYRVRPMREGTLEFPPIKIAYYDTARRTYATVTTAPIPIQATATTQIATANEDGQEIATGTLGTDSRPLPSGLSLSPTGTREASLLPSGKFYFLLALAGPATCLLAVLASPFARGLRALRTRRRRTGALGRARAALGKARTAQDAARAVRTYLAERLELAGAALTPAEARDRLVRQGLSPVLADACRTLLGQLDEVLYRPDSPTPLTDTVRALRDLLPLLDSALSAPPPPKEDRP